MPLNIVFLKPQDWSRPKTLLLKHYYHCQGVGLEEPISGLAFWLCCDLLLSYFFLGGGYPRARYDWTTGLQDNESEWRKVRVLLSLVPLASPCRTQSLIGLETQGLLDFQGKAGITSILQWNLRPVMFGVCKK